MKEFGEHMPICKAIELLTTKTAWFFKDKTPCHSTFTETFRGIDIENLESILSQEIILSDRKLPKNLSVAMDGKRLNRKNRKCKKPFTDCDIRPEILSKES